MKKIKTDINYLIIMTRKTKLTLLLLLAATATLRAQNNDSDFMKSFKAYRDSMFADYDRFRSNILSNYAAFLDSAWREYEAFSGVPMPKIPKPPVPQQAPPDYQPPQAPKPVVVATPDKPAPPEQPKAPEPVTPPTPQPNAVWIDFYGLRLPLPKLEMDIPQNISDAENMSAFWNGLQNSNIEAVAEAIYKTAQLYSFGDWEIYLLSKAYAQTVQGRNPDVSVCLQVALMLIMDYDVTMAQSDGHLLLLIPFEQKVYNRTYVVIGGERYYMFPEVSGGVSSPGMPEERGHKLDLVHTDGVRLPMDPKPFAFTYDGITLKGNVNRNIIRLMADYPSVDVQSHAANVFDSQLRSDIYKQIRQQVSLSDPLQTANKMLHFSQLAFRYKTDDEQFGREKYFFFEELLYYPFSDCEDRSVFFANLVRNILGYSVVLVQLPEHQATAVAFPFEPPKRNYIIKIENSKYYICDPTYMHADVGMMHEDYFNAELEVQAW